jgi:16S rRNA processing protein RimM
VDKDSADVLPEGEYYYHEILDCEVVTDTGETLGTVTDILSPGANDVWVVTPPHTAGKKGQDILLPVIDDVVLDVNIADKRVTVHILDGLI